MFTKNDNIQLLAHAAWRIMLCRYGMLHAAKCGDLAEVKRYLYSGTSVQLCNSIGLTALHLSSSHGFETVVSFLVDKGADINAQTQRGNTPLHMACLAQQLGIANLLIREGANVNDQTKEMFTPLYMAAQNGNVGIVLLLLRSGADKNIKEKKGFGPIDVARQQGHEHTVVLLSGDVSTVSPLSTFTPNMTETFGTMMPSSNLAAQLSPDAEIMISSLTITESDSATGNSNIDDSLPSYEEVMANKQLYGIKDVT